MDLKKKNLKATSRFEAKDEKSLPIIDEKEFLDNKNRQT